MPPVVGIVAGIAATAAAASTAGILGATAFTLFGTAVTGGMLAAVAITTGAGLLMQAFIPDAPKVSAASRETAAEAAGARWSVLGQSRTAGSFVLFDASDDNELWQVIVAACHPIQEVVEHRLDDEPVTLDGGGWVQTPEKWRDKVQIIVNNGGSAAIPEVVAAFDYWTADHKGEGLTTVAIRQKPVGRSQYQKVYPGAGHRLRWSAVVKGRTDLLDPRNDAVGYSENAALHVLAHLRRDTMEGGLAVPDALIDMDSFVALADVCNEPVGLKAGGTEKRYVTGGIQSLGDDPRQVLAALLRNCDADLYLTPEGKVAIRYGFDAAAADETLTDDHVLTATWRKGTAGIERVNRVVAAYPSADHGYKEQVTPPFDSALATNEARRAEKVDLPYCPSGTQAQRLARRRLEVLTSPWQAQLNTTLAGLVVQPTGPVKLDSAKAMWTGDMRVARRTVSEDLTTVGIEVAAKPQNYGAWDPETDEQDVSPQPAMGATDQILAAPEIVSAQAKAVVVNGLTKGVRIEVAYAALEDDTVEVEIESSLAGEGDWGERRVSGDATRGTISTQLLDDGQNYDVRVRFRGPGGGETDWSVADDVSAQANAIAPGAPTQASGSASATSATLSARAPQDESHARLRFYLGAVDDFAMASAVGTVTVGAGAFGDVFAGGLSAESTYYVWATSLNASGVEGDPSPSASFTTPSVGP